MLGPRIYCFNKPKGIISGDFLRKYKYNLIQSKKEKIGHFGTLDPFASGLFMTGVAGAARLNDLIHELCPKTYRGVGIIGQKSDTGDCDGIIMETVEPPLIEFEKINSKIKSFIGEYWQQPPYYSATKHEGKPLYEYARAGIFIDKPRVKREVIDASLISIEGTRIEFLMTVSSGTYIRVFFEDLCQKLGSVGHLIDLERKQIGGIHLSDTIDEKMISKLEKERNFIPDIPFKRVNDCLKFQEITLTKKEIDDLKDGKSLEMEFEETSPLFAWAIKENNQVMALLEKRQNKYWPKINWK